MAAHDPLTRSAVQATVHCLAGCAIGEVLGMVVAAALAWGNASYPPRPQTRDTIVS